MEIIVCQEQARVPVTVFRLKDRINLGNVEQLIQKAQEAFANGVRDLLIDLTHVPSITSAGLGAIHAIYKLLNGESSSGKEIAGAGTSDATRKSSHLKILNPVPDVRRILKIVGFDAFIDVYDNQQEALLAF
jgi:anti-anti-sigma regulatory factor